MLSENLIKGQIIELKVQEELLRYGFDVSIPSYNASKYDLIADTGEQLLKIQVKKAIGVEKTSQSDERFTFQCTTQNVKSSTGGKHKYTADEIDYFATVWKDKVYFIPVTETSTQKTISVSNEDYLSTNVFKDYIRLTDEELYNYKTFGEGKNYCIDCGCEILSTSIRCVPCQNKARQRTERPSREELKELIRTQPFTKIASQFNVSDNAIRKWCKIENLPYSAREIKKYNEEEWEKI